ncbi:MAG: hypothetical protein AB1696_16020, partial [Planctomycetota bacterium]
NQEKEEERTPISCMTSPPLFHLSNRYKQTHTHVTQSHHRVGTMCLLLDKKCQRKCGKTTGGELTFRVHRSGSGE